MNQPPNPSLKLGRLGPGNGRHRHKRHLQAIELTPPKVAWRI